MGEANPSSEMLSFSAITHTGAENGHRVRLAAAKGRSDGITWAFPAEAKPPCCARLRRASGFGALSAILEHDTSCDVDIVISRGGFELDRHRAEGSRRSPLACRIYPTVCGKMPQTVGRCGILTQDLSRPDEDLGGLAGFLTSSAKTSTLDDLCRNGGEWTEPRGRRTPHAAMEFAGESSPKGGLMFLSLLEHLISVFFSDTAEEPVVYIGPLAEPRG